jgi:hypothetical protein
MVKTNALRIDSFDSDSSASVTGSLISRVTSPRSASIDSRVVPLLVAICTRNRPG